MIYLLTATNLEKLYLGCGLFGAGIFIVRMIMMLVGLGGEGDAGDMDLDVDTDLADADIDAADGDVDMDIDVGFRLLTLQGLMAFVMMFGFTGYALTRSSAITAPFTLLASGAVGAFTMWLVARLFAMMLKLQSSGTVTLDAAVGEEGSVYLTIPAQGTGQVQVKVGQHLKVVDAVSEGGEELKTGVRVYVEYARDGQTLAVRSAGGEG